MIGASSRPAVPALRAGLVERGKAKLVLVDGRASAKPCGNMKRCVKERVPCCCTKETGCGQLTSRENRTVMAIIDGGLRGVQENLRKNNPGGVQAMSNPLSNG